MSEPHNRRLSDSLTPSFVGPLRVGPKSRPRRSWPYPVNGYAGEDRNGRQPGNQRDEQE